MILDKVDDRVSAEVNFQDTISLRERLEESLRAYAPTANVSICRFHANVNTKTIRFDVSLEDSKAVRNSRGWIESHFSGARLLQPDWFPIKIDRVPKHFANQQGSEQLREDITTVFGKENKVEAVKIRHLGTSRPEKAHCSAVVFLSNKNDQAKLLQADEVRLGGYTVFAREYKRLPTPYRCSKCQMLGHKERTCDNEVTCSHCGQRGHLWCESPAPKCVNCSGPHPSSHRDCRAFRAAKEKLRARSA